MALWRREATPREVTLTLPWATGGPRVLFEAGERTGLDWDGSGRVLRVDLPIEGSAALVVFDRTA